MYVDVERYVDNRTKDWVGWISYDLVKCCITYQSLLISEGNMRWSCPIALIVYYYFYTIVLPHSHTWVCCSQINPNCMASFPIHSQVKNWEKNITQEKVNNQIQCQRVSQAFFSLLTFYMLFFMCITKRRPLGKWKWSKKTKLPGK